MILGTNAGLAVVLAAGGDRRRMEGVDLGGLLAAKAMCTFGVVLPPAASQKYGLPLEPRPATSALPVTALGNSISTEMPSGSRAAA